MNNRAFASLGVTAIGAALLIASLGTGAASASSQAGQQVAARGGTLRVDSRSDFDYVDPALAYFTHSWQLQYATQLKLMNYPDADGPAGTRLRPEAAAGFPIVSNNGRTYTFRIKKGFRFSNGTPVRRRTSPTRSCGRSTRECSLPRPRSWRTSPAPRP